jgi:hypothetical protein
LSAGSRLRVAKIHIFSIGELADECHRIIQTWHISGDTNINNGFLINILDTTSRS